MPKRKKSPATKSPASKPKVGAVTRQKQNELPSFVSKPTSTTTENETQVEEVPTDLIKKNTNTGNYISCYHFNPPIAETTTKKATMFFHHKNSKLNKILLTPLVRDGVQGSYFIPVLPTTLLLQLLMFSKDEGSQFNSGTKVHNISPAYNKPNDKEPEITSAQYYMYDFHNDKNLHPGLYKTKQSSISEPHAMCLDMWGDIILNSLVETLNKIESKEENEVKPADFLYHPGIVKTLVPKHQYLHLDDSNDKSWVLHMPLSTEGLRLRIGWYDKPTNTFKQHFIAVPFGSALLLHSTVWHAGHYGKCGNLRFHALFVRGPWKGKNLVIMDNAFQDVFNKEKSQVERDMYKDRLFHGLVTDKDIKQMKKVWKKLPLEEDPNLIAPEAVIEEYVTESDERYADNLVKSMNDAFGGSMWKKVLE